MVNLIEFLRVELILINNKHFEWCDTRLIITYQWWQRLPHIHAILNECEATDKQPFKSGTLKFWLIFFTHFFLYITFQLSFLPMYIENIHFTPQNLFSIQVVSICLAGISHQIHTTSLNKPFQNILIGMCRFGVHKQVSGWILIHCVPNY